MSKRILIRFPNWIGDILLATPALRSLRARFPESAIDILIKESLAPILEGNPYINTIIRFSPKEMSLWGRLSFYRSLRIKKYDIVLLFTNSFESALAAFLSGAKEIIGYKRDFRCAFLTKAIKPPSRTYPRLHMAYYYGDLVKHIDNSVPQNHLKSSGAKSAQDPLQKTFFPLSEEERSAASAIWKESGLDTANFVVGFGTGAAFGSAKRWAEDSYAELGSRIVQELNGKILIFGGSEDKDMAERLVSKIGEGAVSVAGKTSLKGLASLIEKSDLYITNDSGPMHIAAALNTPVLAIFGSTDPSETSPLSDSYVIVRKGAECAPCWLRECPTDHACMTSISVNDVMEKVHIFFTDKEGTTNHG